MTKKKYIVKGEKASNSGNASPENINQIQPPQINPAFNDISANPIREGEEVLLDERLSTLHLVRKSIPRDGNCLFSAVAGEC